jgi:hypothetical protein
MGSRLWVFQEVNSGTEVTMLCGASQVTWETVSLCATYMRFAPDIRLVKNCFFQNAYMMRRRSHHNRFAVPNLLDWGRGFTTCDPLDRVYALMGMPPFAKMNPWEADYHKSRLELYREVTERCILELDDLEVLSFVQHIEEVENDFPSWVPHWDQQPAINHINASPFFNWRTSGETRVSAKFKIASSDMRIEGIVFDIVDAKTNINIWRWFHSEKYVMKSHPVLEVWKSQKSFPTAYITGEALMEAYAKTFSAGTDFDNKKSTDNREGFMSDFLAYITQLLEVSNEQINQYPELKDKTLSKGYHRYERRAYNCCWNRSYFTTKKGYMGIGSNALETGDIVYVLFGGKVPYILRPKNGYYQLVGDAYVHGIMEGEAIKQWQVKESGLEKRVFEVR